MLTPLCASFALAIKWSNNTYWVELLWGLSELINLNFSEEGLGVQYAFTIIVIILLLLLWVFDFAVERK